jgi:D-3-phosphoglycerate dehydrogenase
MTVEVFQVDPYPEIEPYEIERDLVSQAGGSFVVGDCLTEDEVIERGARAEILWLNWEPLVPRRVLEELPACRLIVRWGVGYDQISVPDATELGIAVANAPGANTEDVAEHAIGLLIACARRIPWFNAGFADGGYPSNTEYPLRRMLGRTLGIVGVGRIGSAVARRGLGLGLRVIGADPVRPVEELRALGVEAVGLNELLERADYVTIHVPLTPETRGLIGRAQLERLRPDAVLINTSRGPVVDEAALVDALHDHRIGAAALDVFATEPLPANSGLRAVDNVLLTPHAAGYSLEAMTDLRLDMGHTAADWIATGWSDRVVNPTVRGTLRPRLRA